jgi:transcriptional regulator with XRE-family HTH domain
MEYTSLRTSQDEFGLGVSSVGRSTLTELAIMPPSKLGELIRTTRVEKGISLREFARRICKSPAFVTELECDTEVPSVKEDTLRTVARELALDADRLFVLAQRTPRDLVPESEMEFALYRKVKAMPAAEQKRVLRELSKRRRK